MDLYSQNSKSKNKNSIKIILLGDSSVGKTSIITRYISGNFPEHTSSTIGTSFESKELSINGVMKKIDIWDTIGSEKFRSINTIFYRGADIVLLIYDITDYKSFQDLKTYWIKEIEKNLDFNISKYYLFTFLL